VGGKVDAGEVDAISGRPHREDGAGEEIQTRAREDGAWDGVQTRAVEGSSREERGVRGRIGGCSVRYALTRARGGPGPQSRGGGGVEGSSREEHGRIGGCSARYSRTRARGGF
jgi:hypothetical protein